MSDSVPILGCYFDLLVSSTIKISSILMGHHFMRLILHKSLLPGSISFVSPSYCTNQENLDVFQVRET